MTDITAVVEANDIDVAVEQIIAGARSQFACPVQRVLQAHVDRVAVVFQGSWHLGAQLTIPATKGVALPTPVVAFIAAFDEWVRSLRRDLAYHPEHDLAVAKSVTPGRPDGLSFTTTVPSKPMVEPLPAPAKKGRKAAAEA